MADQVKMSPAEFKVAVDQAVMRLLERMSPGVESELTRTFAAVASLACPAVAARPEGFRVRDVVWEMIRGEGTREFRKRVGNRLATLKRNGILIEPIKGVYLAGDAAETEIYDDPFYLRAVRNAFINAGGFMTMPEILKAIGLVNDKVQAKRIRAIMRGSDMFEKFVPLKGMREHWCLKDAERIRIPVPGRMLETELRLQAFRMSKKGAAIAWRAGLLNVVENRRKRISTALADARELWGITPEAVVADEDLGRALDACLDAADDLEYDWLDRPGLTIQSWWREMREEDGLPVALDEAWRTLESPLYGDGLVPALDVATWFAIGRRLHLDAAALSRGCLEAERR